MDSRKIGERLMMLRGEKTQEEVAKATGIAQESISFYENGKRIPSDEAKIKLAEYYGVTVQSLFFEE